MEEDNIPTVNKGSVELPVVRMSYVVISNLSYDIIESIRILLSESSLLISFDYYV